MKVTDAIPEEVELQKILERQIVFPFCSCRRKRKAFWVRGGEKALGMLGVQCVDQFVWSESHALTGTWVYTSPVSLCTQSPPK